jgi:hypothetical protein
MYKSNLKILLKMTITFFEKYRGYQPIAPKNFNYALVFIDNFSLSAIIAMNSELVGFPRCA